MYIHKGISPNMYAHTYGIFSSRFPKTNIYTLIAEEGHVLSKWKFL